MKPMNPEAGAMAVGEVNLIVARLFLATTIQASARPISRKRDDP